MTIKKRLARSNIAMLVIPILTAAALALLGIGAVLAHRPQKARRRQRDLDRTQGAQAHGTGSRRSRGGCQGCTGRREQCLTPVNCA